MNAQEKYIKKLDKSNLCKRCAKRERVDGMARCQECREAAVKFSQNKRIYWVKNNLCAGCGKPAIVIKKSTKCEDCWFKSVQRKYAKTTKGWEDIKELFYSQDKKCAYTGRDMVIGENLSIDHKIARSVGGKHKIDNLQWIDFTVNKMKQNLKEEDFFQLIREIHSNIPKGNFSSC